MSEEHGDLGPLLVEQFREQLNNLSAAIQLLTPVVRGKGGEQYEPYLAICQQSMYRMLRMLHNIEYLQLERDGQQNMELRVLDLAGLCRELAAQAGPLIRQAGLEFLYQEERSCMLTRGEGRLLRRMLLELLSNAVKAAGPKGGRVGIRLTAREERLVATVWDNGPGYRARFMPGDQNPLARPEGLGLGLKVVQSIVAAHKGTIVFEQREEQGCRAVVSLPLHVYRPERVLRTPEAECDQDGGFSEVAIGLASVLPYQSYLPGKPE